MLACMLQKKLVIALRRWVRAAHSLQRSPRLRHAALKDEKKCRPSEGKSERLHVNPVLEATTNVEMQKS
jgi:hypothetical protein